MTATRRNIELKAHCEDLSAARAVAERIGARRAGAEEQCDTFFVAAHGRLKLRQRRIDGSEHAELIWYDRPNIIGARGSNYIRTPVPDAESLRTSLARSMGLRGEVRKHRTVYLHDNVRIHLDDVADLGTFMELEAIVDETCDDDRAQAKLAWLTEQFSLVPDSFIGDAYADHLFAKTPDTTQPPTVKGLDP